jgi:hypothetical protein
MRLYILIQQFQATPIVGKPDRYDEVGFDAETDQEAIKK